MNVSKKLKQHLHEAIKHIERLEAAQKTLSRLYPLDQIKLDNLSPEEMDKLDVLAFRFAKLQDLLGSKIFREYLSILEFPVEGKNFLTLLKELDKEQIVDLDIWSEFRAVRNNISHDYPYDNSEKIDAVNYLIENVNYLTNLVRRIKEDFETLKPRN